MPNKISVIIAIYNIESYLRCCLDSVINQTFRNLEIILVDDGSTDSSSAICDEYAKNDERIKVIHKINGGLYDTRNAGLMEVSGDYIGFVDGDDYIEADMYETMLEEIIKNKAQIAVCNYRKVSDEDEIDNPVTTNKAYVFSCEEALDIYIREDEKYRILPAAWSKLYARDILKGLDFTVRRASEDILYATVSLCRAERIVFIDKYLYNYIVDRKDSIMNHKIGERRLKYEVPTWKDQIEFLKNKGYDELSDKAAYYFYRRMLFYFIELRLWKQNKYADKLAKMLKSEKALIRRIYRNSWVKTGDKVRVRIFLFWPSLYYYTVRLYDKFVLPIRLKGREKGGAY